MANSLGPGRPNIVCMHPDRKPRLKGQCKSCYDYNRYNSKRRLQMVEKNLHVYGITLQEYDSILDLQYGVCAICGEAPSFNRRLAVDHDHKTGLVRGLLCGPCNSAIGLLKDSPEIMMRAAEYVRTR